MDYKQKLKAVEDKAYLISMSTPESLLELGYSLGFNEKTRILDICCGYGEMLRLWAGAFGIRGLGIDLYEDYVIKGMKRLKADGLDKKVNLMQADARSFSSLQTYDVVCLSGENLMGSLAENINFCQKFLKPKGVVIIGTPYYKSVDVPSELIDFEGPLLTLSQIYSVIKDKAYNLLHFCTDSPAEWERYISWSGRRDIKSLQTLEDKDQLKDKQAWIDHWYEMYFDYRRTYEAWLMLAITKR